MNPILKKQLEFLESWPGFNHQNIPYIRYLGSVESRKIIFWCFQNPEEFSALAEVLGEEYLLCGLRSGHMLMDYTEENIDLLTRLYADQILHFLEYFKHEEFMLAGNCQGAGLMLATLARIEKEGVHPNELILLESTLPRSVTAPVRLIYGRDSLFNPFKKFFDPGRGLKKFYQDFSLQIIPCQHGQFFQAENIHHLIKGMFSDDYCVRDYCHRKRYDVLPDDAYRVEIKLNQDRLDLKPKEYFVLEVTILNVSPIDWGSDDLYLANHWLRPGQSIWHQWLDWKTPIKSLKTGETITIAVGLHAPTSPGEFLLEFDMLDDGLTWFKDRGSKSTQVTVSVEEEENHLSKLRIDSSATDLDVFIENFFKIGATDNILKLLKWHTEFTPISIQYIVITLGLLDRMTELLFLCRKLLASDERDQLAYRYALTACYKLGDLNGLEELCESALRHFSGDSYFVKFFLIVEIHRNRLLRLESVMAYEMELQDLNSVLNELYNKLENKSAEIGERLKISATLVETEPSISAYLKHSSDLMEMQAYSEAETVLNNAVSMYRDDHKLRYRLAELLSLSRGEDVAIEHYLKTLELFRFHKKSYKKVIAFYEKRQKDLAVEYCKKGAELFLGDAWFDKKLTHLVKAPE